MQKIGLLLSFIFIIISLSACDRSRNLWDDLQSSPERKIPYITQFSISGIEGTIDDNIITLTMPNGTELDSLTPMITHTGVDISPLSGIEVDFSTPVDYTVTAADGSINVYRVTVNVVLDPEYSYITQFSISGIEGTIGDDTITLTMPNGTELDSLTPTITHTGVNISPLSGTEVDFSTPVDYTVTAADGSINVYRVTVNVALNPDLYSYKRSIVINHDLVGMDNTGTLPVSGFPVLINLSGDWLKTTAMDPDNGRIKNNNGYDIVFSASDGVTPLFHEVEMYDCTAGTLIAWVRIDSLSKALDTIIYIYYGNGFISSPTEVPAEVWDAGYKGVWHLDEDQSGIGTADLYADSTSNNNHGDDQVSATGKAGKISSGQEFDNLDDYIHIANSPSLGIKGDITISAWINRGGSNDADTILAKTNNDRSDYDMYIGNAKYNDVVVFYSDKDKYAPSTKKITDTLAWHYIAAVRRKNIVTLFIDGSASGSTNINGKFNNNPDPVYIGRYGADIWNGYLDEIRLSNKARSADWMVTEFNNQKDTSIGSGKFIVSLGSEM